MVTGTLIFQNIFSGSNKKTINTIQLVVLELNGPVNTIKVMSSMSVHLTTLFLGRVSPLSG